ncbi:MAG TPA: hypothetical protein VJ842_00050 [Pyrinomonadaceae bacterium]|nr:hypothetical protein [Pyrinomonadaceae bacterium]
MNTSKVDFTSLQWESPAAGTRSKSIIRKGKKLRLVEFTRELIEQEWCVKGHTGYVLEGELEISFNTQAERFTAGDGILISGGERERHKARAISPTVKLVLVEDA